MAGNEPATDLDVERAILRECAGALEACAAAFRRADSILPGLHRPAREQALVELAGLARRTFLAVSRVAFPANVNERKDTP